MSDALPLAPLKIEVWNEVDGRLLPMHGVYSLPEAIQAVDWSKSPVRVITFREKGKRVLQFIAGVEESRQDECARLRQRVAALEAEQAARPFTQIEVLGHDGKVVAAPCCLLGCQYGELEAAQPTREAVAKALSDEVLRSAFSEAASIVPEGGREFKYSDDMRHVLLSALVEQGIIR